MHKTTIYLPEAIEQRIRRAAKQLGVSRAEIARTALEEYLARTDRTRALPPSVGMGDNSTVAAADYEERLEDLWGQAGRRSAR